MTERQWMRLMSVNTILSYGWKFARWSKFVKFSIMYYLRKVEKRTQLSWLSLAHLQSLPTGIDWKINTRNYIFQPLLTKIYDWIVNKTQPLITKYILLQKFQLANFHTLITFDWNELSGFESKCSLICVD